MFFSDALVRVERFVRVRQPFEFAELARVAVLTNVETVDARSGGDTRTNRRNRADRDAFRVVHLTNFFVAEVRAVAVDPSEETFAGFAFDLNAVVFAARRVVEEAADRRVSRVRREGFQVVRVVRAVGFDDEETGDVLRNVAFVARFRAAPRGVAADERHVRFVERADVVRTVVNPTPPTFGRRTPGHVDRLIRFAFRVAVALNAVLFDDRVLNEAFVTDRFFRTPRRRNRFDRRFRRGDTGLRAFLREVLLRRHRGFVATGATAFFARHHVRERAHNVNRATFGVEHFKEERFAGGNFETDGAVFFDRNRADDAFDAFGLEDRNGRAVVLDGFIPSGVRFRVHLDDADRFPVFLEFRELFRAFENVVAVEDARRRFFARTDLRPFDDVRFDRVEAFAVDDRHRVVSVVLAAVDEFLVAVNVHQVQTEEPVVVRAAVEVAAFASADEEDFFAERIRSFVGVNFTRLVIIDLCGRVLRPVADFGPSDFAGNAVEAFRVVQTFGRVDDPDRAVEPSVVAETGEHDFVAARDGAGFGEDVRPSRLVAVEGLLVRAVRVHRPEGLDAPEGFVRVFPTGEDDATVFEHARKVFRFAVGRDDVNVLAVGVAARNGEGVRHRHAADVGVLTARAERNFTVRRVNRVEVVVVAERQLFQVGAVDIDFVEVERLFAFRLEAEEELRAVVGDVRAPEAAFFTLQDVENFAARVQPDDQHAPARFRHKAVAVARFVAPLVGGVALFPFRVRVVDQDDLFEVDQRVFERDIAFDFANGEIKFFGRFFGFFGGVDLLFEFGERGEVGGKVDFVFIVGDDTVGDGASVSDFELGLFKGRLVVALEQPFGFQLLHPFRRNIGGKTDGRGQGEQQSKQRLLHSVFLSGKAGNPSRI